MSVFRRLLSFVLSPAGITQRSAHVRQLGVWAFEAGQPIGACPFKGRDATSWMRGWHEAWKQDSRGVQQIAAQSEMPAVVSTSLERSVEVLEVSDFDLEKADQSAEENT